MHHVIISLRLPTRENISKMFSSLLCTYRNPSGDSGRSTFSFCLWGWILAVEKVGTVQVDMLLGIPVHYAVWSGVVDVCLCVSRQGRECRK